MPTWEASGTYISAELTNTANVAAPAGVADGSIVIIPFYIGNPQDPILTPPAGFTLAGSVPVFNAGINFRLYVMWHRASGAEAGPYTVTWTGGTGSTNRYIECQAHRFEGVITTGTPIEATTSAVDATNVTSSAAVSTTTLGADRLLLHVAAQGNINTWTPSTGFTLRGGGGFSLEGLFTKSQAAAGGTGTVQAGQVSGTSLAWLGALIPPPSAVTGTGTANLGGLTSAATGTRTAIGTAAASLGGLTATAVGEHGPTILPAPVGSWYTLLAISKEAQDPSFRRAGLVVACPNDGEPLSTGPRGELYCKFDGWRPD